LFSNIKLWIIDKRKKVKMKDNNTSSMKRIITVLTAIYLASIVWAQSPEKMSYQGIIRNSNGNLISNQGVGIKISILQDSSTGRIVYQEIYNPNPQTNDNGLVTLEIGTGIPIIGEFSTINWASGPYFIKTEIDPSGATNYTVIGISQLLSVPYALYAKTAEITATTPDENDPIWVSASTNYYTKTNMQSSGLSQLHFDNITNKPTSILDYGITDAVITSGNQIINGDKTFIGKITIPPPVNETDAATKAYVDSLMKIINKYENQPGIVKDVVGNLYTTIKIGSQVWMAENLKTTRYKDGTPIPIANNNGEWYGIVTPAFCWYDFDQSYDNVFGVLYNWYTVNTGDLCPNGWHVPTDAEWTVLENYLITNGYNYDGTTTDNKIAKSLASTFMWNASTSTGAIGNNDYPTKKNATGFTALPGGNHDVMAPGSILELGCWWSATDVDGVNAWNRRLFFDQSSLYRIFSPKDFGYSVRCMMDY
jgi:uncharacterized protein (TIGR02145 family)